MTQTTVTTLISNHTTWLKQSTQPENATNQMLLFISISSQNSSHHKHKQTQYKLQAGLITIQVIKDVAAGTMKLAAYNKAAGNDNK
jgi:hypothetical protein